MCAGIFSNQLVSMTCEVNIAFYYYLRMPYISLEKEISTIPATRAACLTATAACEEKKKECHDAYEGNYNHDRSSLKRKKRLVTGKNGKLNLTFLIHRRRKFIICSGKCKHRSAYQPNSGHH